MSFARHETFYLRDGWLGKSMRVVNDANKGFDYFRCEAAPDVLGMGKNMVQSLKFWLIACGLISEKTKETTRFGELTSIYDPYFEDEGTLWLLHYNLVTNDQAATTWYWFFNEFGFKEFNEDLFLDNLNNWCVANAHKIAASSLKKDYQCFLNTYLSETKFNKRVTPEDNISCPLRELHLIKRIKGKSYRLNRPDRDTLPPLIVLYSIKCWQERLGYPDHITISNVLDGPYSPGRAFNLGYDDVIYYLEWLKKAGLIDLKRQNGLDALSVKPTTSDKILEDYYCELRGDEYVDG